MVCTFGGALNICLVSRALHVRQLLLHSFISGGAFWAGRGSQRKLRSRSVLYTIFESSSLARVSWVFFYALVGSKGYRRSIWEKSGKRLWKVARISR